MMKKIFACAVLALLGSTAMAADTAWYVGGDLSSTKFKAFGDSERKTGLGVYGGFQLNENIAFEGQVRSLGRWEDQGDEMTASSVSASVLFKAPMGNFALFGRVGYARNELKLDVGNASYTEHGSKALFGAGVEYMVAPHVALRAEYVNLGNNKIGSGVGSFNVKLEQFNLGASYRF